MAQLSYKNSVSVPFFKRQLQICIKNTVLISLLLLNKNRQVQAGPVPDDSDFSSIWKDRHLNLNDWSNWHKAESFKPFSDEEMNNDMGDQIQNIAIGVGVFIVAIFVVTCIVCFCCPICIIAKMRQRRNGQVYRTIVVTNSRGNNNARNNAGPPVTTALHLQNAVTPTNNMNPSQVNCIAISNRNTANSNSPYPVQETVTVVPIITPQPQPMTQYYGQGQNIQGHIPYGNPGQNSYQNNMMPPDLPPPYPGLSREQDPNNLPYNPYFSEGANISGGMPPSAPPKQ